MTLEPDHLHYGRIKCSAWRAHTRCRLRCYIDNKMGRMSIMHELHDRVLVAEECCMDLSADPEYDPLHLLYA